MIHYSHRDSDDVICHVCFISDQKTETLLLFPHCFPESTLEWSNCPLSLSTDISSSLRTLSHSCPPQSHCQIFLHVSVMANSTAQAFTATSAESNFDTSSLIPVRKYSVVVCAILNISTICDKRVQRYQVDVFGCGLVAFRTANCSEFHTPCGTEKLLWISHTMWNWN